MAASIPFSYYRGGTSKAVFFHDSDLPPPGNARDRLILRLMGSPDPMQIDGMGGTHPVTSKVAIISKSKREGIDVDYLFAQVSIKTAKISYDGGCGNISSAVGPFAINEGLVKAKGPVQEVSMWMVGTQTRLITHVPIDEKTNRAKETGNYRIHGCPGTGAPIVMDYKETAGGAIKRGLLPTTKAIDEVTVGHKTLSMTICDIAHIIVFGRAVDFDIVGDEESRILTSDQTLISNIREFRGKAAQLVGLCSDWRKVDEEAPNLPYVILLSETDEANIRARLFLDNHCHTSMAGAGATCTAACAHIPGTLVNSMAKPVTKNAEFSVQHPLGQIPITVRTKDNSNPPEFNALSFNRSARYIAKGELFVPEDLDSDDANERLKDNINGCST